MYKRIGWIELDVTQVIRAVICHSDVGGAPWYPDDWTVIGSIWVVDQRIVGESDGRDMRASVVFATANVAHVKLAIGTDAPVAADGLLLFVDEKWSLNWVIRNKIWIWILPSIGRWCTSRFWVGRHWVYISFRPALFQMCKKIQNLQPGNWVHTGVSLEKKRRKTNKKYDK